MSTIVGAPEALGRPRAGHWRARVRPVLLACGAVSSVLYVVATDGIGAAQWNGYDRTRQMVSDLFAIGSPARPMLAVVGDVYSLLLIVFGIGLWASAHGNGRLRRAGGAMTA